MRVVHLVSGLLLGGLGLALTAAACSSDAGADEVAAPNGVRVEVLQNRSDITAGKMSIKVVNDGSTAFTVTGARVTSARLAGDVVWRAGNLTDEAYVAPKTATDLPAEVPGANCTAATDAPTTARLEIVAEGGGTLTTTPLPVTDPFQVLPALTTLDCREQRAGQIAGLTLVDPLQRAEAGGKLTGTLTLRITPTGREGTLRLGSIRGTTLITPPGADAWPVNRTVDASSGVVDVPLAISPARCDLHAIAEDKVGTLLRLTASVDGEPPGEIRVAAGTAVKAQIQQYVFDACEH